MKFCTHWNPSWLKKYTANCLSYVTVNLYLSFLFHNNNSVYTIFTWKNWITIPASFRNGEILYSTLALNFKDWPFGIIVTRHFRPKSGHLNDRVYCKPIEHWKCHSMRGRAAFYDQPFLSYGSYWLLGKENRYMMILKIFFFKKQQFPQVPESIQKYSSKYMAPDLCQNIFSKSY